MIAMRKFTVVVGGLATAAVALFGAGTAGADTHVCVGGYTDNTGKLMGDQKAAQGDPCDVLVEWPAALGIPPNDPTNTQGSLDVGVPRTVDAYYAAGGGTGAPVTLEGASLGSLVVSQAGDAIRVQNNGVIPPNMTVITNGNVYGDSGLQNDPGVGGIVFDGAKVAFGMPQEIPQMGINRNGLFDVYGAGANQMPQTQIAEASTVQWNHIMPVQTDPHETYFTTEPTTGAVVQNEIYNPTGEQNPISAAAATNGTPLDPATDAFFDATFPVNSPVPEPVRLDTPEFFGELPCSDGKFTPGESPC